MRNRIFFAVVIVACIVGFFRLEHPRPDMPAIKPQDSLLAGHEALPDFTAYQDVNEKKSAFFDFMLPLIKRENTRIAVLREQLQALSADLDHLNSDQRQWLADLCNYYDLEVGDPDEMKPEEWPIKQLLRRVDQVPPSLAMAQAANESAWGTSRFAEQGNNLYGQWCFKKGCGLIPTGRDDGADHEVARFDSPLHSVQRYIHNLNTHAAYRLFRKWRAEQRQQNQSLEGAAAAETLTRYSTRGEAYVEELQAMIRKNELQQYDTI